MNASEIRQDDDLTEIKGIGVVRQTMLAELLDVHTFQDLAALSSTRAADQLRASGHTVSTSEIEAWITDAKGLISDAQDTSSTSIVKPKGVPAEQTDWKTHEQFFVDFQIRQISAEDLGKRTKVHRMKDGKEKTWPGFSIEQLIPWILANLSKSEPKMAAVESEISDAATESGATEEPGASTQPERPQPATIEVDQVRIFQPPSAQSPVEWSQERQFFIESLRANEPFSLKVSFSLKDTPPASSNAILAQAYARNRANGVNTNLGESRLQTLIPGRAHHTSRLSEASLPPGSYRLQILVYSTTRPSVLGFLEMPLLQVV